MSATGAAGSSVSPRGASTGGAAACSQKAAAGRRSAGAGCRTAAKRSTSTASAGSTGSVGSAGSCSRPARWTCSARMQQSEYHCMECAGPWSGSHGAPVPPPPPDSSCPLCAVAALLGAQGPPPTAADDAELRRCLAAYFEAVVASGDEAARRKATHGIRLAVNIFGGYACQPMTTAELDEAAYRPPCAMPEEELFAWFEAVVEERIARGNRKFELDVLVRQARRRHQDKLADLEAICAEASEAEVALGLEKHISNLGSRREALEKLKGKAQTMDTTDEKAAIKSARGIAALQQRIEDAERAIQDIRSDPEKVAIMARRKEAETALQAFREETGIAALEAEQDELRRKGGHESHRTGASFETAVRKLIEQEDVLLKPGCSIIYNVDVKKSRPPERASTEFDALVVRVVVSDGASAAVVSSTESGGDEDVASPAAPPLAVVERVVECKSCVADIWESIPKLNAILDYLGDHDTMVQAETPAQPDVGALRFTADSFPSSGMDSVLYIARAGGLVPPRDAEIVLQKALGIDGLEIVIEDSAETASGRRALLSTTTVAAKRVLYEEVHSETASASFAATEATMRKLVLREQVWLLRDIPAIGEAMERYFGDSEDGEES